MQEPPPILRSSPKGFTLVEVVLALGLCSFALVSLVSLLPLSLGTAKNAVEITRTAKLTQQVISELSQSRFTSLAALSGTTIQRTFDYDGLPATDSNSIYFTLAATIDASTTLPGAASASPSLVRVKIEVKHRGQAVPSRAATVLPDLGY